MWSDWDLWKSIQHSMALEGWIVTDRVIEGVAIAYHSNELGRVAEMLAKETQVRGVTLLEIAPQVLQTVRARGCTVI
jgi:hypothetical protein